MRQRRRNASPTGLMSLLLFLLLLFPVSSFSSSSFFARFPTRTDTRSACRKHLFGG